MRFLLSGVLLLGLVTVGQSFANEKASELSAEQLEEIKLIEQELQFLSSKLLGITGQTEYELKHQGYDKLLFGACGDGTNQGVKINCVSPGSTAFEMGLRSGDIVYEINEVKLDSLSPKVAYKHYVNTVKSFKDGEKITVKFRRGHSQFTESTLMKALVTPSYSFKVTTNKPN